MAFFGYFVPGPILTIEGICIQLSSGVWIFLSWSRSALLIGIPFTGKATVWHSRGAENYQIRTKTFIALSHGNKVSLPIERRRTGDCDQVCRS